MKNLKRLLKENEDWLMERILLYAKQQDYTKYTSTLLEAWRLSISGISAAIIKGIDITEGKSLEFSPDEDYSDHPITQFGVQEAHRHRKRGIALSMFLGLLKYYRQTYQDLVLENISEHRKQNRYNQFIVRCFDMFEIALCSEWNRLPEDQIIEDLQNTNRHVTNEKNRYLTLFESLSDPVILLDEKNQLINLNVAAAELIGISTSPGEIYYHRNETGEPEKVSHGIATENHSFIGEPVEGIFPWLLPFIETVNKQQTPYHREEIRVEIRDEERFFQITFSPMMDISSKYEGAILVFNDITRIRDAQYQLKMNEERLRFTLEATNDGMWDWNIETGEIFFSPQYYTMIGYEPSEFEPSYQNWKKKIHPDDIDQLKRLIQNHLDAHSKGFEATFRMQMKSGDWLWILGRGKVVKKDDQGNAIRMVGTHMDISKQKQMEKEIRTLASTDPLTGTNNRRRFLELGEVEVARSSRYHLPLTALMIDIDHFKKINDTYGHSAGDKALKILTRTSLGVLRKSDIFGRMGGEEFAVILVQTDDQSGVIIAERIRQKISEIVIFEKGSLIQFTISIGVAAFSDEIRDIHTLLNQADQALYIAKDGGRNQVICG